ncbi:MULTISPECIES: class I adenylate-forming enzyme family protein [Rhodopseudomonas]|uniref:AMP-dependent synthetase n=1 Tax=Rhodopseudomonas palustris TaxID=1076 RepID=A0A0D7EXA9_RHOPL|nr:MULTISPECIES: class I adenylate-forming enzyme family protein [Rhodopseudomonas]KIZ45494.1 AMP-dependent synthetase [Rhodopseudomonas palustris]MDF3814456.1 class I adenylate-forming enzyme family protein [Rhodopseudomonas sp. BAL398]WOK18881.1 class I adenylate-forming enzyme family protein [Rhodopseudomonas sp. BAL398]
MSQTNISPTLDGLFRRSLARQPDALALVDPADKMRVSAQLPKRLTYAQADRAIAALAAHFAAAGLPPNSVIAVQLPNTVEFILTVLAAHRAGLVVALLPQLWRQAELTMALNRTGARAIVAAGKIDGVNHADLAMNAAAEAFSIRHVCGFGDDLPEGMASLDAALYKSDEAVAPATQDGRRAAIISFDVTADGFRAIPRTHLNLIAGGLVVFLESGMAQGATVMSAVAPSSFASLASSLMVWLLSGGTLALHHPFDDDVAERQIVEFNCEALVAPAPLALRLADTGLLARAPSLRTVIGLWRAPEQVASSATWSANSVSFTDIYLFGEAGLFGARRSPDGVPATIQPGPHGAPRDVMGSSTAGEILVTPHGTLGLRGPMIVLAAYQPQGPSGVPSSEPQTDYVDTGYAARLDRSSGAVCITAPPPTIMAVGGYRFLAQDLQEWAKRLGQGALLTALPDRLSGYRLAGRANDNARAREALSELGLNPLMVEAFRDPPGRSGEESATPLTRH